MSVQESCLGRGLERNGLHICVIGCIGSGKTTFAHALREAILENEDRCEGLWEPVESNPLLPLFYKDQKRYALAMQIYMLNRRLEQQRVAEDLALMGVSSVQDSSLFGDSCFTEMLAKDGTMSEEEVGVYASLFANMSRGIMYPSLVVYLKATPETSLRRVCKRGRGCEAGIPLDYLTRLTAELDTLATEFEQFAPVLTLDVDQDLTPEQIKQLARDTYAKAKEIRKHPIISRIGV